MPRCDNRPKNLLNGASSLPFSRALVLNLLVFVFCRDVTGSRPRPTIGRPCYLSEPDILILNARILEASPVIATYIVSAALAHAAVVPWDGHVFLEISWYLCISPSPTLDLHHPLPSCIVCVLLARARAARAPVTYCCT